MSEVDTVTSIKEEEIKVEKDESQEEANEEGKMEIDVKTEEKKESTPVKKSPAPTHLNPNLNYRVKVSGLPRFYSSTDPLLTEFKKMLREELKLDFYYIRSPKKGNSWLYITFTNQADQERALTLLKRYTWKNRTIICTLVVADVLKRKGEGGHDIVESKKAKLDIPLEEQMLMSTIPYHSIAYEEQLSKKNEEASCHLKWLFELIQKRTYPLSGWIDEQITKHGKNLPFVLEEVKPSPVVDGYRNRCEFRVGINPQNQEVTVGYRVDNQEDGSVWVAPPDSLRHLPKQMIEVVKAFEKFIKESPYPPHVSQTNPEDKGLWRLLLIRMNKKGEVMLVVMVHPPEDDTVDVDEIRNLIVKYFTEGGGKDFNIKSIYLHLDKDKSGGIVGEKKQATGVEHMWGSTYLQESILDLELEVTPSFYFHWNTYGAEQLYSAVVELAGVDAETTVLDLCCGSGGMGLTLARHCKDVIGVELMDVNVVDAKKIASKNGLTNCEFLQGKIDDLFPQILEKVKGKKVVPILDPPRNGISQRMIINLRNMKEAQKVIYVCSNHKLPLKNLLDLGTVEPGPFADSNPFVPTRVIPIDMSPHALRCELVILCERVDMKNIPKPTRQPPASDSKKDRRRKGRRLPRGSRFGFQGPRSYRDSYSNRLSRFEPMRGVSARDSLYPPPLRGALYQEPQRGFRDFPQRDFLGSRFGNYDDYDDFPPTPRGALYDSPRSLMDDFNPRFGNGFDCGVGGPGIGPSRGLGLRGRSVGGMSPRAGNGLRGSGTGGIPSLFDAPLRPPPNFDGDVSRYSNFRRDVEDAIDSSYPQFRGGNKFSLESAILEREKRAFVAGLSRGLTNGATQYNDARQSFRPMSKRGRGGGNSGGTWR